MQDAVTQMILIKVQLEKQRQQQQQQQQQSFDDAVQQLAAVRDQLEALVALVETTVSDVIAAQLRRELLWQNDPASELFFAEPPLILRAGGCGDRRSQQQPAARSIIIIIIII